MLSRVAALEGFGVEDLGLLEQVPLGLLHDGRVEVLGELGQGAEDGVGLLDVDLPLGQRRASVFALLEPVGEPHDPVRAGSGGAGAVGVPVRGRGRPGDAGEVEPVGVGQHAGLELGDLGGQGGELVEGGGGLIGVHRPEGDVGHRQSPGPETVTPQGFPNYFRGRASGSRQAASPQPGRTRPKATRHP
jgi:hypothetical protein